MAWNDGQSRAARPRAAVDDQLVGLFGDLRVEVVVEHAQGGFLLPSFAGDLAPARGVDRGGEAHVPIITPSTRAGRRHRIDSGSLPRRHVTSHKHGAQENGSCYYQRTADRSASHRKEKIESLETPSAAGTPIASPTAASDKTWRSTIQTTAPRCAPSAIRIPISRVRRATVYDIVPYKPTQAISSARMAKARAELAKMISWFMI